MMTMKAESWVFSLAISQEGLLISGSWYKLIKVWNIQTGEVLKTLKAGSWVFSLAISKEGLLISGSDDETVDKIKVWGK